ncbi:hypothetical protein [Xanthocytophaga agilis]|uniref:SH3b domain-containing protein n=1 Tax=Xanthocytophaga agilis TaxID=3048010 RepID=A0AAE3UEG6_9BACT|nr:hypothetical protein [Xanthocytophaga agilis]MDJ1499533.1 hypothetical protein [Xanthocytophaga agilis]
MKFVPQLLFFTSFSILCSCDNSSKKSEISILADTLVNTDPINKNKGNLVDYDKVKVIKSVYVTNRNGIELKDQPSAQSETLGQFEYGQKLDVIEVKDNWLGILNHLTRRYEENGKQVERTAWEKVYVQKESTGELSMLSLETKDLNVITAITLNDKTEYLTKPKPLTQYVTLELVDKATFLEKKGSAVNYFLTDTTQIQKKNGVIELPCEQTTKRFVDKPDAEEDREVYSYAGQYESLKQYVIEGTYYESWDYKFVDKRTGKLTQEFGGFPYISANKQYVACIYANPYESTGEFELYTIRDANITSIVKASFKNWAPSEDNSKEIFWGADGALYVRILHEKAYFTGDENINESSYQYLRIKTL